MASNADKPPTPPPCPRIQEPGPPLVRPRGTATRCGMAATRLRLSQCGARWAPCCAVATS
jgi:hypothetical protein